MNTPPDQTPDARRPHVGDGLTITFEGSREYGRVELATDTTVQFAQRISGMDIHDHAVRAADGTWHLSGNRHAVITFHPQEGS
jgi:hypothetical protein